MLTKLGAVFISNDQHTVNKTFSRYENSHQSLHFPAEFFIPVDTKGSTWNKSAVTTSAQLFIIMKLYHPNTVRSEQSLLPYCVACIINSALLQQSNHVPNSFAYTVYAVGLGTPIWDFPKCGIRFSLLIPWGKLGTHYLGKLQQLRKRSCTHFYQCVQ